MSRELLMVNTARVLVHPHQESHFCCHTTDLIHHIRILSQFWARYKDICHLYRRDDHGHVTLLVLLFSLYTLNHRFEAAIVGRVYDTTLEHVSHDFLFSSCAARTEKVEIRAYVEAGIVD